MQRRAKRQVAFKDGRRGICTTWTVFCSETFRGKVGGLTTRVEQQQARLRYHEIKAEQGQEQSAQGFD